MPDEGPIPEDRRNLDDRPIRDGARAPDDRRGSDDRRISENRRAADNRRTADDRRRPGSRTAPDQKRIKVIVPIPMDAAGVANRAQQLPPEFVAPGFAPEFVAVPWGAALGDSYHDMLLMDWTVFQAGIDAEAQGYAGVLIDTVSDSGLRALRSRLTIPVVGPGEATFATAMMLGKKFTVLTMWPQWFPLYEKTLTEYGWWSRCASLRSIDTRPDVTELLAGKEEVIFAKLKAEAEKAMVEDGADVIVLGSTTMHQSAAFLAENLPIPVLNPGRVAWKQLELLIGLGLTHSKKAFPAPEVGKDADIRKGWS